MESDKDYLHNASMDGWDLHFNGSYRHPPQPHVSGLEAKVDAFVYSAIFIIGLFGNIILIPAVLRHSTVRQSPVYYCILILAVVDVIYLLTAPAIIVEVIIGKWMLGDPLCYIFLVLVMFGTHGEEMMVTLMACIEITRLRTMPDIKAMTTLCTILTSAIVCIVALLLSLPDGIFATVPGPHGGMCEPGWGIPGKIYPIVVQFFLDFILLLCILILIVFYCLRRNQLSDTETEHHMSVTMLVMTIIDLAAHVMYLIFFEVLYTWVHIWGDTPYAVTGTLMGVLTYGPGMVRPLVYFCFLPPIRQNMIGIVTVCCRSGKDGANREDCPLIEAKTAPANQ